MSEKQVNTGLIAEDIKPLHSAPVSKDGKKPSLKFLREKDRQLVRGKFHYNEVPGGVLEFTYNEYKEDPIEKYRLFDGQIYTLPRGVARHLNRNPAYPEYDHVPGNPNMLGGFSDDGATMRIKRMVRRCSFESLEFMADEDISAPRIEVVEFVK